MGDSELVAAMVAGLALHFWRDLSEPGSGVALLWPFSYRSFSLPHAEYALVMVVATSVCAYRCWRARVAGTAVFAPSGW